MRELLGLFFIFSGIVFGVAMFVGFDCTLKEKIEIIVSFEVFLCLVIFGSYLLTGGA